MKKHRKRFNLILFYFTFFALTLLGNLSEVKAQRKYKSWHHYFDLGIGFVPKDLAVSLGWSHLKGLGATQRFKIGYGLRLNLYRGKDREFLPIPLDIRKDEALMDTLIAEKPLQLGLGLGLYMTYDISERWTIGLNADMLSYSRGLNQTIGTLHSTDLPDTLNNMLITPITPHEYGLFKARTEDFGMLNAELYLAYHILPKWRIKLGVQRLWTEYRTPLPFLQNNTRYFHQPWLILAGITFVPFSPNIKCPPINKKQKLKKLKEGQL